MSTSAFVNPVSALVSVIIAVNLVPAQSTAQQPAAQTLSIAAPRPLAAIIRMLEARHELVITYEDPPYVHSSELADVTDQVRRTTSPTGQRVLVPRGGPFSFRYSLPPRAGDAEIAAVLTRLLAEYNQTGYGGTFGLQRSGNVFHVVPTARRTVNGMAEAYDAVLNVSVPVLSAGERTAYEALQELADVVTRITSIPIHIGTTPLNVLMNSRMSQGASGESARAVLLRTLAVTRQQLSWQLLYDPLTTGFVLNIHVVRSSD